MLIVLGLVLFRNGWGAYSAAALLPVLWVMRTGWRRGRTIVAVVAALNVAWLVVVDVVLGAWTAYVDLWSVAAVGVLLVAVGTTLLFREPVNGFLRAGAR